MSLTCWCTFKTFDFRQSSFFNGGSESFRYQTLVAHGTSVKHNKCAAAEQEAIARQKQREFGPVVDGFRRMEEGMRQSMTTLFHVSYFVAKNELPFTMFPKLVSLQQRVGVEMPDCYSSDKACAR